MNAVGVQSINGKSFISFLDNTKTFEMMKFAINIIIQNSYNDKLKSELNQIINSDELIIENILNTINQDENYYKLLNILELLSPKSKSIKKLYNRLLKKPLEFKTKVKQSLKIFKKLCY